MRRRPNILFILSDDQGAWALGSAGNGDIQTPNLDALAARGIRLGNFFCASPVCSPARATLLTGKIPSAHGVHDYVEGHAAGEGRLDFLEGQALVTESFAEHGYTTGIVGKWHLGASDRPRPGFHHWYVLEGGRSDYNKARLYRGTNPETVDGYLTDIFANEAIAFLESAAHTERPFFLSLNFTAPHKPWKGQHPREVERMYENCAFESCPQESPHPWLATRNGMAIAAEPDTRAALIGYFAAVTAMDEAIGRVLEELDLLEMREDTIVVFSSDNGFNCGHHGVWGKGNGTLPQNMYDSSVKVPMIVAQPNRIAGGLLLDQLLSAYDLPATLLDLAGIDPAPFEVGPGKSFASLLLSTREPANPRAVVVFDEYGPVRMIRTLEWKYVHRFPLGPNELYNLMEDPGEQRNRVDDPDDQAVVRELRIRLHEWFELHSEPGSDGRWLPVSGGGQSGLVSIDPLGAFSARQVD